MLLQPKQLHSVQALVSTSSKKFKRHRIHDGKLCEEITLGSSVFQNAPIQNCTLIGMSANKSQPVPSVKKELPQALLHGWPLLNRKQEAAHIQRSNRKPGCPSKGQLEPYRSALSKVVFIVHLSLGLDGSSGNL